MQSSRGFSALAQVLVWLLLLTLSLPSLGKAQMINTGTLFISQNEVLMVDDDFIQADPTQTTTNQGTLLVTGALHFLDGVINEVGGVLRGGWRDDPAPDQRLPDFHTLFKASATSNGPSAINDGGTVNALIDGPVRRAGGGEFVFPTGDVRRGQVHRGLIGLSAPALDDDIDAHYFWRNGTSDFGNRKGRLVVAVSDKEYWRLWGDSSVHVFPLYEATSAIGQLLETNPGATLANLTLVGWDGTTWMDLAGRASQDSGTLEGQVRARLRAPRDYLALTFGVRLLGDQDSDNDGVPNDREWDPDGDGEGPDDTDGDGTPDYIDPDDDNDGVPTSEEDWDDSGSPHDDDEDGDGVPDYLDPDSAGELRLWVSKTADRDTVAIGETIRWTLSVENKSAIALTVTLMDVMPWGMSLDRVQFQATTGGIVGRPSDALPSTVLHPDLNREGLILHWPDIQLDAGGVFDVSFEAYASVGLAPGSHRNQAYAFSQDRAETLFSNLVEVPFQQGQNQNIDCATVVGRVFNDKNANGKLDPSEPGIAAARIGEQSGLLLRTDNHGRFHLPCELVQQDLGRNLVLKLDERTLPTGFEPTSENPRIVRLTRGKMVSADFGAALSREVTLNIGDCTFIYVPASALNGIQERFHPTWTETLSTLIKILEQHPSRLVIEYRGGEHVSAELLQRRLDRVEQEFWTQWQAQPRRHAVTLSVRARRLIGTETLPCALPDLPDGRYSMPADGAVPSIKTISADSPWAKQSFKPTRERRFFAASETETR